MNALRQIGIILVYTFLSIFAINLFMSMFADHTIQDFGPMLAEQMYDYADDEAVIELNQHLDTVCLSIASDGGGASSVFEEQCRPENMARFEELCSNIDDLPNEQRTNELITSCQRIESGELQQFCSNFLESQDLDFEMLKNECALLRVNNSTHKDVFMVFVEESIKEGLNQNEEEELARFSNTITNLSDIFVNNNPITIFFNLVLVLIFSYLLYLFSEDFDFFLKKISKLFFNIGIFLLIPFAIIELYFFFMEPNTTSIIQNIYNPSPENIAMQSAVLFPLLLSMIFSKSLLLSAAILCAIGATIRIIIFYRG
ncbi:MAG: hypothetical protein ACMXX6_01525 [Candidatus Woesearchaeota archaeon]